MDKRRMTVHKGEAVSGKGKDDGSGNTPMDSDSKKEVWFMKKSLKARCIIHFWKYPLFFAAVQTDRNGLLNCLKKDAERILKYECRKSDVFACLVSYRNFASVYLARIRKRKALWILSRALFRENRNIEILTDDIGPGLLVLHNLGAVIRARSIGEDVTISQGVTIGEGGSQNDKDDDDIPTIGDHVLIATNALVLGRVSIGNNAVVGAGAVVTKDVDSGTVVVGNPAHPLKKET